MAEPTLAELRSEVASLRGEVANLSAAVGEETSRRNRWTVIAACAFAQLAQALVTHLLS